MESAFDKPGKWFVVKVMSGHETTAQKNIEARIRSLNLEEKIFECLMPKHDVAEIKAGKKVIRSKKTFPGYLLVRCIMDDETWTAIKNTPDVAGFVGSGDKPIALKRKELDSFLTTNHSVDPTPENFALGFDRNDPVKVKSGPFAEHDGYIIDLNNKTLKLKVMVNLFGRETPVELDVSQVVKL
jgi:transcriptional antiterminator NusG